MLILRELHHGIFLPFETVVLIQLITVLEILKRFAMLNIDLHAVNAALVPRRNPTSELLA